MVPGHAAQTKVMGWAVLLLLVCGGGGGGSRSFCTRYGDDGMGLAFL